MAYVLVENGVVVQKQPQAKEGFIEAPDHVVPGYGHDGTDFYYIAPDPDPWPVRIARTRYAHEIAGTTFVHSDSNTYGIATDRQSQALTTGAAVQARRAKEAGNTSWSKRWKTASGFVSMNADDILAMGDAVDAHVQKAFDRESDLLVKVEDGTIEESDLGTGWP